MSEKKLLFVFNPKSGMGLIKNNLLDIIDVMVKAGYDPTVILRRREAMQHAK